MSKDHGHHDHDDHEGHQHGAHDHHHHHDHEHSHPSAKEKFSLRSAFHKVVDYIRHNKAETVSLAAGASLLLASSALTIPLLPATAAAIGLGAVSVYLMKKTSDTALDNIMAFGKKAAISPMRLGLIVGALTTVPELLVSLNALAHGENGIAVGNVLGGNIAHTLLVLGATAAVAGISAGKKGLSWAFNTKVMAGATALFAGTMALGSMLPETVDKFLLYPAAGISMLTMAGYYLKQRLFAREQDNAAKAAAGEECETGACVFHDHEHHGHDHGHEHQHDDDDLLDDGHGHGNSHKGKEGPNPESMPSWFNAAWATGGVAAVIGASNLLVESAKHIGTGLNLQDTFMGAVGVGLGMALPELVLGVKAALKKKGEFALGNIIGCNIFTTLGVGGAVTLAAMGVPEAMKVATPAEIVNVATFAGSAGLATAALMANQGSLKKWHGWLGMGLYAAYAATAWMMGHNAPIVETPKPEPAPAVKQIPAAKTVKLDYIQTPAVQVAVDDTPDSDPATPVIHDDGMAALPPKRQILTFSPPA